MKRAILVCLLFTLTACDDKKTPEATPNEPKSGETKPEAPKKPTPKPEEKVDTPKGTGDMAGATAIIKAMRDDASGKVFFAMEPTLAQYEAVFKDKAMAKAYHDKNKEQWGKFKAGGKMPIPIKPEQTELKILEATTEDFLAKNERAKAFPGGYSKAQIFKPKLKAYGAKFIKPGEKYGFSLNAFYFVGGKWVFIPKPWKAGR